MTLKIGHIISQVGWPRKNNSMPLLTSQDCLLHVYLQLHDSWYCDEKCYANIPRSSRCVFCWGDKSWSLLVELTLHSHLERKLGILQCGQKMSICFMNVALVQLLEQSWLGTKSCACRPVLLEEFICHIGYKRQARVFRDKQKGRWNDI